MKAPMRLKMILRLDKPELDIEYRRAVLSLLKESFLAGSRELYQQFYGEGTAMKPFTFGLFLSKPVFKDKKIHLESEEITLNFSTYRADLGIFLYNSLVKKRKRGERFPFPDGNSLLLKRVTLIKEKTLHSGEAVFKTLSPFLVRLHHREFNQDEYLTPDQQLFRSQLEENLRVTLETLTGLKQRVDFTPVKMKPVIPITHFNGMVQGNTGLFKLSGSPAALDFFYKAGIGSRRAEGFGLLELVG
jgi:CRISPR-associated endoribonuclease Cas6